MTSQVNINLLKRQQRSKDVGIGGMAARWYDKSTKKHRMAEMKEYAKEVARHIQNGSSVLEVAPGPGYLAIELAKLGTFKIVGLDISKDFVEIAKRNAKDAGVQVEFQQGSIAGIPFPDNSFDFIICTAAFKNFKDPLKALNEICRVLRSGGTALIIDMNRNASDREIDYYTENIGAKGIDKFFMKLMFKHFLRNGAYTRDEFVDLISKTTFREHRVKEEAMSLYVYLVK